MPKKGIHPDYHEVSFKTFKEDGSEMIIKGKTTSNVSFMASEINFHNHPAWKDDVNVSAKESVSSTIQKFVAKYYK